MNEPLPSQVMSPTSTPHASQVMSPIASTLGEGECISIADRERLRYRFHVFARHSVFSEFTLCHS